MLVVRMWFWLLLVAVNRRYFFMVNLQLFFNSKDPWQNQIPDMTLAKHNPPPQSALACSLNLLLTLFLNPFPSLLPNLFPSLYPNLYPSLFPNFFPSLFPNFFPSLFPYFFPSLFPFLFPSLFPNHCPTHVLFPNILLTLFLNPSHAWFL